MFVDGATSTWDPRVARALKVALCNGNGIGPGCEARAKMHMENLLRQGVVGLGATLINPLTVSALLHSTNDTFHNMLSWMRTDNAFVLPVDATWTAEDLMAAVRECDTVEPGPFAGFTMGAGYTAFTLQVTQLFNHVIGTRGPPSCMDLAPLQGGKLRNETKEGDKGIITLPGFEEKNLKGLARDHLELVMASSTCAVLVVQSAPAVAAVLAAADGYRRLWEAGGDFAVFPKAAEDRVYRFTSERSDFGLYVIRVHIPDVGDAFALMYATPSLGTCLMPAFTYGSVPATIASLVAGSNVFRVAQGLGALELDDRHPFFLLVPDGGDVRARTAMARDAVGYAAGHWIHPSVVGGMRVATAVAKYLAGDADELEIAMAETVLEGRRKGGRTTGTALANYRAGEADEAESATAEAVIAGGVKGGSWIPDAAARANLSAALKGKKQAPRRKGWGLDLDKDSGFKSMAERMNLFTQAWAKTPRGKPMTNTAHIFLDLVLKKYRADAVKEALVAAHRNDKQKLEGLVSNLNKAKKKMLKKAKQQQDPKQMGLGAFFERVKK